VHTYTIVESDMPTQPLTVQRCTVTPAGAGGARTFTVAGSLPGVPGSLGAGDTVYVRFGPYTELIRRGLCPPGSTYVHRASAARSC